MIFYIRPLEEFLAENYVCIWLNIIYSENGYLSIEKINSFEKEFWFNCKIKFDWVFIGNEILVLQVIQVTIYFAIYKLSKLNATAVQLSKNAILVIYK